MLPGELLERTEVVAGPATGGALLAHTLAGLLDGRRALTHPPCSFAPFTLVGRTASALRDFYARADGRAARAARRRRAEHREDVRAVRRARARARGGTVLATVEICDRLEAVVDLGVPNYALVEYPAPENYPAAECPMCRAGEPITTF